MLLHTSSRRCPPCLLLIQKCVDYVFVVIEMQAPLPLLSPTVAPHPIFQIVSRYMDFRSESPLISSRSAIIDPVTFTANRTGSKRSRWRTNSDRVLPIRSCWRFDGWPPGFKPVPVDIRSKLTARNDNHRFYI